MCGVGYVATTMRALQSEGVAWLEEPIRRDDPPSPAAMYCRATTLLDKLSGSCIPE